MANQITKAMSADEKMARCNEITRTHLIPVLEGYYGRGLTPSEIDAVEFHVNMLFMNPCPLNLLMFHDLQFGSLMLAGLRKAQANAGKN